MGYRSDVKYIIEFETAEQREAFLVAARMEAAGNEALTEALKELVEYTKEHYADNPTELRLAFDHVKWYDGYPDVDAHHKLMEMAEECEGGSWQFWRVGEEAGDVEDRSGGEHRNMGGVDICTTLEWADY